MKNTISRVDPICFASARVKRTYFSLFNFFLVQSTSRRFLRPILKHHSLLVRKLKKLHEGMQFRKHFCAFYWHSFHRLHFIPDIPLNIVGHCKNSKFHFKTKRVWEHRTRTRNPWCNILMPSHTVKNWVLITVLKFKTKVLLTNSPCGLQFCAPACKESWNKTANITTNNKTWKIKTVFIPGFSRINSLPLLTLRSPFIPNSGQ